MMFQIANKEDPAKFIFCRYGTNFKTVTDLEKFPEHWVNLIPAEGVLRLMYNIDEGGRNMAFRNQLGNEILGWDKAGLANLELEGG